MRTKLTLWMVLLGFVAMVQSCTIYDNPEPFFEDSEGVTAPVQRKVLLISIDGLSGREIEKEVPPNLKALMETSKYTFNSLSDEVSSGPSTWTTMMTGVSSAVHMVDNSNFKANPDPNDQHAAITFTPTIFYRLLMTRPEFNTTVVSSWESLVSKLLIEMEEQIVSTDDEASKNAAVKELQEEDPEIMIVNFREVEAAAEAVGYTLENAAYAAAINKVDGYIGEIVKAVESRKRYEEEDWMVIITSNHGGSTDGSSGSDSFEDRNTFTLLHYKNFKSQELNPALITSGNFPQLAPSMATYNPTILEAMNAAEYDFTDEEMAVEFKFKRNQAFSWSGQPFIMGKTLRYWSHAGGTGWGIGTEGNKLRLYLTFDNNTAPNFSFNIDINDMKWHHFAFSLKKLSANSVQVLLFSDGLTAVNEVVTLAAGAQATMKSNGPLFIGARRSHNGDALSREDVNMADFRMYNKALTTKDVERIACYVNHMPEEEELKANVIADYTLDNMEAGLVKNNVVGKPDLKPINANKPTFAKTLIATRCNADDRGNVLITNEDIAPMIFYWMRVTPDASWKLSGNKVIDRFEEEFVKLKN